MCCVVLMIERLEYVKFSLPRYPEHRQYGFSSRDVTLPSITCFNTILIISLAFKAARKPG
jgi:hypothetical protein